MESLVTFAPPDAEPEETIRYSPVRLTKFVVLNLLTFGAYSIVWFFRMWKSIKKAEKLSIWPWARALFGVLFYYSMLERLKVRSPALLVVGYLVLSASWRLPDPYWLASVFGFVFLVPAVRATNDLNVGITALPPSAGWRLRDGVLIGLGVAFFPLVLLGTFGQSMSVTLGAELQERDLAYLEELGVLQVDEVPLYFYSNGLWSIKDDGVLISDWGVTSYWTDPVTEGLTFAAVSYSEIVDVEVNFAATTLGSTIVRITTSRGDWFSFSLSPEGELDHEVIDEIEGRRIPMSPQTITAEKPEDAVGSGHSDGEYGLFIDVDDENTLASESPNPVSTLRQRYDLWRSEGGLTTLGLGM